MSKDCEHMNPLIRGGTSQDERYPAALKPDYAKVDEKSMLDLLTFIKKYSGEYSYYRLDNQADGNWEIFFSNNAASRIADVATFDINKAIALLFELSNKIQSGPHYKKQLTAQFDLLFTLLYRFDKWLQNIDESLKLYIEIHKEIGACLSIELLNLASYYKVAVDQAIVTPEVHTKYTLFPTLPTSNILEVKGFSAAWFRFINPLNQQAFDSWQVYFNAIEKSEIYEPTGSIGEQAVYTQEFLMKSMEKINASFNRLANKSDTFLEDLLENYANNEPHIGLLLTFLNLFRHAQEQMNELTERHLDYYLKDVLQLKYQQAIPDKAHIIFEPARRVPEHKIEADTALSAGKDDTKKEILYYTEEESIINTAQIASVKNIFIDKSSGYKIYASPIANSPDGMGADFEEEPGKWKPFGEKQEEDERTMPDASIGFLITSDILLMKEGLRKISIDINCDSKVLNVAGNISNTILRIHISGEEAWIINDYHPKSISNESDFNDAEGVLIYDKTIRINTRVKEDDGAIALLDPKLHDERFTETSAGIFIECVNSPNKPSTYKFLKDTVVNSIGIETKAESKSEFILQNDQLLIDPAKPFMPFGSSPKVGASFIIGSSIFNNNISELTLSGEWNNYPHEGIQTYYKNLDNTIRYNSFKAERYTLQNGKWVLDDADEDEGKNIFEADKKSEFSYIFKDEGVWKVSAAEEEIKKFDIKSKGGFIKLVLSNNKGFGFGHSKYPKKYAEQAIKEAANVVDGGEAAFTDSLPNEPYTPLLSDFKISYKAYAGILLTSSTKSQYNMNQGKFYQVHPFGVSEMHPWLNIESMLLFPQFSTADSDTSPQIEHNGELIIGIKDLEVPASLNLLFKMAEGSEDPELAQQKIIWSYLLKNKWVPFKSNEILSDDTRNLTGSGILSLSIPKEATDNNTILPGTCTYIMGAIEKNPNAVCQLIDIHPQALLATFKDNDNDPLRAALPAMAGSISKLKVKDEKIKSVTQPYASFGGKMQEDADGFYLRTAERLRHKSRGISIWDYERMILQEFPDIYKVKCINHTAYGPYGPNDKTIDAEFAPGYICIILIPATYNQNAINPYEPKVTKTRILDIETFIKRRISPFAAENLKVLNPQYEQIQLDFEVAFYQQYADRGFYEKQLNDDIKRFLSPWAYEEGKEITLGNTLHRSTLIDFVEELYYVDYLKDFKMKRYTNNVLTDSNIELAQPTNARSAFVTINHKDYTLEHIIKEIS